MMPLWPMVARGLLGIFVSPFSCGQRTVKRPSPCFGLAWNDEPVFRPLSTRWPLSSTTNFVGGRWLV